MSNPAETGAPPARSTEELGPRARAGGVIVWSAFLSAAVATMVCFALVDPQALAGGEPPGWWTTRLRVYALGFFFFWVTGMVAAGLCWVLSRPPRP